MFFYVLDTEYYLVLRLFTKSGYNDAAVLQFKTDSLIELTIILASVIGCLLLAFIVGFIYLWVTKRIVWYVNDFLNFCKYILYIRIHTVF